MHYGICFNCGASKKNALGICTSCNAVPEIRSHEALSLALSDTFFSFSELMVHAKDIQNHLSPHIEQNILDRAESMLDTAQPKKIGTESKMDIIRVSDASEHTLINGNSFVILGASVRDSRQKIVELAEEKSLTLYSELCLKARSELINPKKRISAEVAWLPGVAPNKALKIISKLGDNPGSAYLLDSIPPLAQANLLSAGLELIDPQTPSKSFINWILKFADTDQQIVVEDVCRDINEDRSIAGFSDIKNLDDVESEIKYRREHYKNTVLEALDLLDPEKLVNVMTGVLELATNHGKNHAPVLVDEIVDSYRNRVEGLLEREAETIQSLVDNIEDNAERGEAAIKQALTDLDNKVRNWDRLAQPIQLSFKSRGIEHELSHDIAQNVRSMAVTLVNEYGMLNSIKGIVSMLNEIFAELPAVVDQLKEDKTALESLERQEQAQIRESARWAKSISYSTDIGNFIKHKFEISAEGVFWKKQHFPLGSISEVRWGGIRHSSYGMTTGTEYVIGIGNGVSEALLEFNNEQKFQDIIERLWPAVCSRIMLETLQNLAAGQPVYFSSVFVNDHGIKLVKSKFLSSDEEIYHKWSEVKVWTEGGCFVVGSKLDKKARVDLSYIQHVNTHILEQIIRSSFKKPGSILSNILS